MYIKRVRIKNFRNFKDFETSFEPFTVITGANNSGKTNLFAAMGKVMSLSSPRNARVLQTDFNDAAKRIVIEIVFDSLTDLDIAAFYHPTGLINAKENTVTIRFESVWNTEEQDVVSESYFVRDDLDGEKQRSVDYTRKYREYIAHYFTSAFNAVEGQLSFSHKQSFGKVIRAFAGDFLKPIEVLLSHVAETIQQLNSELLSADGVSDELQASADQVCDAVSTFCGKRDTLFAPDSESSTEDAAELEGLIATVEHFVTQIPTEQGLALIKKQSEQVVVQLTTLHQRMLIRVDLGKWSSALQKAKPFEAANQQLTEVFSKILRDQNLAFQMLPIADEKLIMQVSAILDDSPLNEHGDGYKSMFSIGLGLAEVLATEYLSERPTALTCLFIEELEANLHPHMQRHIINQLKGLQTAWTTSGRHLQVIVTTHSPSCLRRVSPSELIRLRPNLNAVKWSEGDLESLAHQLQPDDTKLENRRKKKRNLQKWSERLFSEYAEAILSKVVIIVEGETEQGFVSVLADHSTDPDYFGISILNASSGSEIQYVAAILSVLDIGYVCIADSGDAHDLTLIPSDLCFLTTEDKFEKEILALKCYAEVLLALEEYRSEASTLKMLGHLRGNGFPQVGNVQDIIAGIVTMTQVQERELINQLSSGMDSEKGLGFGITLAKFLAPRSPQKYLDAIAKAEMIAKGK